MADNSDRPDPRHRRPRGGDGQAGSPERGPKSGGARPPHGRGGASRTGRQDNGQRHRSGPDVRRAEPRSGGSGSSARREDRPRAPWVPEEVSSRDLDRDVRMRLRSLSKENAERVGGHLVMAGMVLDSDPELAYLHAQAAVQRAGRIDIVREAGALTAYATGRYAEALREFRTVRRLSGIDAHRPMEADCERGLGRPERALKVIAEAPTNLSAEQRAELAIVEAGARMDLGQPEVALVVLDEAPRTTSTWARVDSVKADVLTALGRLDDSRAITATLPGAESEELVLDYEDLLGEDEDTGSSGTRPEPGTSGTE